MRKTDIRTAEPYLDTLNAGSGPTCSLATVVEFRRIESRLVTLGQAFKMAAEIFDREPEDDDPSIAHISFSTSPKW
jgi:hypothetical protein